MFSFWTTPQFYFVFSQSNSITIRSKIPSKQSVFCVDLLFSSVWSFPSSNLLSTAILLSVYPIISVTRPSTIWGYFLNSTNPMSIGATLPTSLSYARTYPPFRISCWCTFVPLISVFVGLRHICMAWVLYV